MTRSQLELGPLEEIADFAERIGGAWTLAIEIRDERLISVAGWLADAGRDFFSVTPEMQSEVAASLSNAFAQMQFAESFSAGSLDDAAARALQIAADTCKAIVLKRFEQGGYDVELKPLSPAYAAYKRRHSYILDQRIGIAYGTLYRAVKLATFRISKYGA